MEKDLIGADDIIAERLRSDPEFRAYWERTALARAIAHRVIAYRMKHQLSQTRLAKILGMKQSAISRLEVGEHNPTWETLQLLASKLGMSFLVGIMPVQAQNTWMAPLVAEVMEHAPSVERLTFSASGTEAFVVTSGEEAGR
ncbi:MAG TPA: helix-turn-helix transcriptional regulator [Chloroflexota bacterium]|nr:helix-turn-helix transcriptional regulator [Chloroflexota bacterium]